MAATRTSGTRPGRRRAAGMALAVAAAAALAVNGDAPADALSVAPTASFTVVMLGNGHGHGMSQYGARGAAMAGLSSAQIVRFYYPNTRLVTQKWSPRIRVGLSGVGSSLVVAPAPNLTVTGVAGILATTGIAGYRLVPDTGTGLALQRRSTAARARWVTIRTGLPNRAEFHRVHGGPVRLLRPDGTSTAYRGFLRAVRNRASGARGGVTVVNRVSLNYYTAGVVPMEMPTSWQPAAVGAQAIAARTYGAYHLAHPLSPEYNICDTTMCQVYGGHAQFDKAGNMVWRDDQRVARATWNQVVEYRGAPILAQFSASNGGWTVDGGLPYLVAKQDPYDNAASGDPYLDYRKKLSAASVARHLGLQTVTSLVIRARDGNGTWRGRVLRGYVSGTDSTGAYEQVTLTGYDFAAAFGIGTTWFALRSSS